MDMKEICIYISMAVLLSTGHGFGSVCAFRNNFTYPKIVGLFKNDVFKQPL